MIRQRQVEQDAHAGGNQLYSRGDTLLKLQAGTRACQQARGNFTQQWASTGRRKYDHTQPCVPYIIAVRDYLAGGDRQHRVVAKYGDISDWDTSRVTIMNNVFTGAFSFSQPLSNWNVSM